jgi:hypothetical protein
MTQLIGQFRLKHLFQTVFEQFFDRAFFAH